MTQNHTAKPLVLGLDPSPLRLGYALAEWDLGTPRWCGTLEIFKADAGWRERQIQQALGKINYTLTIKYPQFAIAAISVEAMFMGPSKGDSIDLADNAGIVCGLAASMWENTPIYRFRPAEWRKANGLKGNATKQECYEHAKLVGFDPPPIITTKDKLGGQDAADAGLIGLAAYRRWAPATLAREQGVATRNAA